ncbi:MAG: hypothetical protein H0X37_02750 [Herpetosiphonaceae bacterium]|nr:hypothetical protein [Herpetosiphonaceae bacterium]
MPDATPVSQTALKFEAEVREDGSVALDVPFAPGTRVVAFVVEQLQDSFNDLIVAAQTTLDFWDNPLDDEDWNNA